MRQCLKKYADFSGRATRAEFWWWALLTEISPSAFYVVTGILYFSSDSDDELHFVFARIIPLSGAAFQLLTLSPSLAVTARRLHDLGRSGRLSVLHYLGVYIGIGLSCLAWALVAFLVVDVTTSPGDLFAVVSVVGLILSIPVAVIVTVICAALVAPLARQGHAGLNRYGPDPRAMGAP